MALSYSTAVKNALASMLYSSTYAALGAGYQQTGIDTIAAYVLTEIEEWSKWFALATAAGAAPDVWEPWLVQESYARLCQTVHPERYAAARKQADQSMRQALESYARAVNNYDPSSAAAFVYHAQFNRQYVLMHCIRLKPALIPDLLTVDAALDEILTLVWNKGKWTFARRPVTVKITRTAFTGGTWTSATKVISGLTGVGTSLAAGTRFYVTSGTGISGTEVRDHVITTTASTTITLDTDIGATDGATDIAGFYYVVSFQGMQASESFDSFVSGKLYYSDSSHETDELCWMGADDFARQRNIDGSNTGRPLYFRAHQTAASTTAFLLSPPPDDDYVLRGEVLTRQPADPTSATGTTGFDKFALEFMPTIRRLQLARVLTNHGRANEALTREAVDELESLLPAYQDVGSPATTPEAPDYYNDVRDLNSGGIIGGAI